MTTPTDQELAAAREINENLDPQMSDEAVIKCATIIHKHNEQLRRELSNWKEECCISTAGKMAADCKCDQLAARCAELEKAIELKNVCLCFLNSVVKSGEQWSEHCENMFQEALSAKGYTPSDSLKHLQELERKAKALDWMNTTLTGVNYNIEACCWMTDVESQSGNTPLEAIEAALNKQEEWK